MKWNGFGRLCQIHAPSAGVTHTWGMPQREMMALGGINIQMCKNHENFLHDFASHPLALNEETAWWTRRSSNEQRMQTTREYIAALFVRAYIYIEVPFEHKCTRM